MLYDVEGAFAAGKAQVAQEASRLNLLILAAASAALLAAVLLVGLLAQPGYASRRDEQAAGASRVVMLTPQLTPLPSPAAAAGR